MEEIIVEIDITEKTLYIGTETSSGCEYKFNNLDDMADCFKAYVFDQLEDYKEDATPQERDVIYDLTR